MKLHELSGFRSVTNEELDLISKSLIKPTKVSRIALLVCFWLFLATTIGLVRVDINIIRDIINSTEFSVGRLIISLMLTLVLALVCIVFKMSADDSKVVLTELENGTIEVLDTVFDKESFDYDGAGYIVHVKAGECSIDAGFKVRGSGKYDESSKFFLVKILNSRKIASYELVLNNIDE